MKIALCGYMGSGKTKAGERLASMLGVDFVDLDETIKLHEKMDVPDIFRKKGELFFRKSEHTALKKILSEEKKTVIALGGGTPCYGNNLDLLKQNKVKLVYLKANLKTLTDRLFEEKEERPLISHYNEKENLEEFVRKHLFERNYFYLQSDLLINIDGKPTEKIVEEIGEALK